MRQIARFHLYLGCFFAPLIIFYALSGTWQTLNLHRSTKDGRYQAPAVLVKMSEVHIRQRWASDNQGTAEHRQKGDAIISLLPRNVFAWFSALMGIGLAGTAILGIILAFQRTRGKRRWLTSLFLASGCLVPVTLLIA